MPQTKTIFIVISYYLLPLTLLTLSVTIPSHELFVLFGKITLYLLIFNLYIKPLALLTKLRIFQFFIPYRRQLGIAAFWCFFFHSTNMILKYKFQVPSDYLGFNNFLLYGGLAGIGMYLLASTSNDIAVRLLKRNWQRLHRIVYAVLFLGLYHAFLVNGQALQFYLFGGVYLVLKIAQFAKFKRI